MSVFNEYWPSILLNLTFEGVALVIISTFAELHSSSNIFTISLAELIQKSCPCFLSSYSMS